MTHRILPIVAVLLLCPTSTYPVDGEPKRVKSGCANPTLVAIVPFEVLESGSTEMATGIPKALEDLLNADSNLTLVESGVLAEEALGDAPALLVKGSVYSDGARSFVALRIEAAHTGEVSWAENYDYTGISADMMASYVYDNLANSTNCTSTK